MEKGLLFVVVVSCLVVVGWSSPSLLDVRAERIVEVSGWQKGASISIFFELFHPLNESSSKAQCLPDFLVKMPPHASQVQITDSLGNIFVKIEGEMQRIRARYPICPGWNGDVTLTYFFPFFNENEREEKIIEIPPLVVQSAHLLSMTTNIILPEGAEGREVREMREGEMEKVGFEEEQGPYSLLGWSPCLVMKIGKTDPSTSLLISYNHESRFLLRLPLSLFTIFCLIAFTALSTKHLLFPQTSTFEEREVKELLKRINTNFEGRINLVEEKERALDGSIEIKKKPAFISVSNKFQARQESLRKEGHSATASLIRISPSIGKSAQKAESSLAFLEKQQDIGQEIDMEFYFQKKLNAREHAQLQYGSDNMKKLYRKEFESLQKLIL